MFFRFIPSYSVIEVGKFIIRAREVVNEYRYLLPSQVTRVQPQELVWLQDRIESGKCS